MTILTANIFIFIYAFLITPLNMTALHTSTTEPSDEPLSDMLVRHTEIIQILVTFAAK